MIKQGAEAKVYRCEFFGQEVVVKQRFKKSYRHPILDDKLTRKRTSQEVRSMLRCHKAGIKIPIILFVNHVANEIYMEEIKDSTTLKEEIEKKSSCYLKQNKLEDVMKNIGVIISKMHSAEIIHGDLTTSNILIKEEKNIYFIDFGLSVISNLSEDMAVDLYVLERAFLSTHPCSSLLFSIILDSYIESFNDHKKVQEVISKLNDVRSRGRKRVMIG
ncbi:EKC/KEOPS complex subunit TP53RK [Hydra vulgaris]|uniref:non-specific serine/threonine protein kinase n=1 Tax=Hydra vulgaris TaxID=6087 RepID=A0ABM4CXT4_HYDVU